MYPAQFTSSSRLSHPRRPPRPTADSAVALLLLRWLCVAALLLIGCGDDSNPVADATTGDAAVSIPQVCADYLVCVAAVMPPDATLIDATYRRDGACWTTNDAAACVAACDAGLFTLRQDNPGVVECGL